MPATSLLLLLAVFGQTGDTAQGIDAFRQGRFDEARTDLQRALRANPGDGAARAFLAMTEAANHQCSHAESEFVSNSDPSLARTSGLAALECDPANFALLARLEARFPADPDVLYESAKLHRKAWDRDVAALYEKAPSSYRVNQLSAEVFETEGKYGEAAAQYAKAIEKAPGALNLHYRLGRCLLLDSPTPANFEKARAEFDAELRLNPDDAISHFQIGQILTAQQKPAEAVASYEKAIALRPEFAEALIAVGKARAQNKQYEEAAALFKRAVTLQPDNEAAHYNLLLAYRNLGRTAEAATEKQNLDRLQKPPEGEFSNFLKKLGDKAPAQ